MLEIFQIQSQKIAYLSCNFSWINMILNTSCKLHFIFVSNIQSFSMIVLLSQTTDIKYFRSLTSNHKGHWSTSKSRDSRFQLQRYQILQFSDIRKHKSRVFSLFAQISGLLLTISVSKRGRPRQGFKPIPRHSRLIRRGPLQTSSVQLTFAMKGLDNVSDISQSVGSN